MIIRYRIQNRTKQNKKKSIAIEKFRWHGMAWPSPYKWHIAIWMERRKTKPEFNRLHFSGALDHLLL